MNMYTLQGVLKKNFAVGVLAAEGTMIVQFSQSRCHLKALYFYFSYFKVYIFSF